jgi:hypothetical protein
MLFRTAVAAFFIERPEKPPSLETLLRLAGVEDLQPLSGEEKVAFGVHERDAEVYLGRWSVVGQVWARLDEVDHRHICLQLYFSQNVLHDLLASGDDAPLSRLAEDFAAACERLGCQVAFIDTGSHYGDESWENGLGNADWVLSHYPAVLGSDANALADERFTLLYVDDIAARLWDSDPVRDDRDEIPVSRGRLVFAGRGPDRW